MSEEVLTLRRRVGDRSKVAKDIASGNGKDRSFHLEHENVFGLLCTVDGVDQVENVHYALDAQPGRVIFVAAPLDKVPVLFDYQYAYYSDDDLQSYFDTYGMDGATVAILEELTSDTARFYDFTSGESTSKRSQIFDHLMSLLKLYQGRVDAGISGNGKKRSGISFGTRSNPHYKGEPVIEQDLTRFDG